MVVQTNTDATVGFAETAAFPEVAHKSIGDGVAIAEVAADLQETVHTNGLGAEEKWGNILAGQDQGPALTYKVSPVGLWVTGQQA